MSDVRHEARLEARHLSRHFVVRSGHGFVRPKRIVRAVDDVSLALRERRVTAVVGESGSGKSVLARMLARIVTPTSGELVLDGTTIELGSPRDLAYASEVQLVLQDPFASINPVHRIANSLARPLAIHGIPKAELGDRMRAALSRVSLEPPDRYLDRYPHELSGGQLQRVSIARALCVNPKVLLADEPISMLDVSVRLGVLNLLRGLCDDEQLAVLYITHDIASARYIADETIVMYAGNVVERSEGTALIDSPAHPYTQLLISSVPDPSDPLRRAPEIEDRAGQGIFPDVGCRFAPRCPHAMEVCRTSAPPMFEVAAGHEARCWLHESAVKVSVTGREQGGNISTT